MDEAMKAYNGSTRVEVAAVNKTALEYTKTYNVQAFINTGALVMITILVFVVVVKLYSG
jgi:hypothetical protein